MKDFDKELQDILGNDELGFEVNSSSYRRLAHHMRYKVYRNQVQLNSFIPMFKLRSLRPLTSLKLGLACLSFFVLIGYHQFDSVGHSLPCADTTMLAPQHDTNMQLPYYDSTFAKL